MKTIKNIIMNRIIHSHLVKNQQGAVLPLVGLTFIIMMLATGFAIDYTRAQIVQDRLQWAVDAAALAGAKKASGGTLEQVQAEANAYFRANFPVGYMNTRSGTPKAEWVETVNGRGEGVRFTMSDVIMENYIMDALGMDDMRISALAEVNTLPLRPLDIVFSVDVSGSMQVVAGKGASCIYLVNGKYPASCYSGGNSKLADAKAAMRSLVTQLHSDDSRFGLVGWSNAVNRYGVMMGEVPSHECDNGNHVSLIASANPNAVGEGNAGPPAMNSDCYWFEEGTIQNSGSLRPMQYFTNVRATIETAINNQKAEGNTDGALGMLWAYNMFRANQGWLNWRAPAENKAIVLLTDGDNTLFFRDPATGPKQADADVYGAAANADQLKTCEDAKTAGITVYTIAYDIDNSNANRVRGKKMLSDCASKVCPNNPGGICYFDARYPSQLNKAMETIGNTMMTMRLTK